MKYGWNLDPNTWADLLDMTATLKWASVPFEKVHASVVPVSPGVYLICAHPPKLTAEPFNRLYNVFYAGLSTTSIRSRFNRHCNNPDQGIREGKRCHSNDPSQMSFYFTKTDRSRVQQIENQLITCFGPPCNRQSGITAKIGKERPAG